MKNTVNMLLVVLISFAATVESQTKQIIGYYPSWKWKAERSLMSPDKIPFDKLTMINYAFFYPLPDGHLVGRDTVGDALILRGGSGSRGGSARQGLASLAHRYGVKVVLSVGGWEDSNNFPQVASNEEGRVQFAHSCLEQIRAYDFDGIDIDWEYPGYTDHRGMPSDKKNFTRLLRTVRDSLSEYGRERVTKYLLTAALPASGPILANYEMDSIAAIVDALNIMTYDFNGPWDSLSGHNAPLYAPRTNDTSRNVDASFRFYTQTLKIPAAKINLGVPFYGHSYSNCTALYCAHSGADTVHFSDAEMSYCDLVPMLHQCIRMWDDRAKAPYLICRDWRTLISYDDEQSVREKANYVLDHNAGGLIIWEITGDYLPDGTSPLLDVIASAFRFPAGH